MTLRYSGAIKNLIRRIRETVSTAKSFELLFFFFKGEMGQESCVCFKFLLVVSHVPVERKQMMQGKEGR